MDNNDDEINASDTENQESRIQDKPIRPSETNEFRTPIQPISIQNLDLDDTIIVDKDHTGDDYHIYEKQVRKNKRFSFHDN